MEIASSGNDSIDIPNIIVPCDGLNCSDASKKGFGQKTCGSFFHHERKLFRFYESTSVRTTVCFLFEFCFFVARFQNCVCVVFENCTIPFGLTTLDK